MAWQDTRDGEGGDMFAGVTGNFVVHLFDHNGDKRGDTTCGRQRRTLHCRACRAPRFFIVRLLNRRGQGGGHQRRRREVEGEEDTP